jgi:hypothetical protein
LTVPFQPAGRFIKIGPFPVELDLKTTAAL